jgi:prepilin-type N-terminal cleavage/methylation domain-containing protein
MSTSTTKKTTRPQAFTLIELLVVISIIAILASLAFPAIGGAMDSAKKTTAKNAAVQIANAVVAYETEYGRLPRTSWGTAPTADSSASITANLISTLSGTTNDNPRAIVFLETSAYKKGKGGTNSDGDYLDPWGGTYRIALDYNYDNTITAGTNSASLRKKVGVWNDPGAANSRRYVNSWD